MPPTRRSAIPGVAQAVAGGGLYLAAQALPDSWRNPVTEFWPTQAGSQVTSVHHAAHTLQPWPGFGVMCLFVVIVYAIAWTLLDRRDA
jgi:ABC-2 type transport system permease protein